MTVPATNSSPQRRRSSGSEQTGTPRTTPAAGRPKASPADGTRSLDPPGTVAAQASGTPGDASVRTPAWRRLFGVAAEPQQWREALDRVSNPDLKLVMAASGTALSVFTVGHMTGNMQVYLGRERYNEYAQFIRALGSPVLPRNSALWVVRIGLLASAAAHVAAGIELSLRALRAEDRTVADVLRQSARRVGDVTNLIARSATRVNDTMGLARQTGQQVANGADLAGHGPAQVDDAAERLQDKLSGSPRSIGSTEHPGVFSSSASDRSAPRKRPRGRRRSVPQIVARSMRSTGAVLGLFTVYHVLDLTAGARPAASLEHTHGDAYGNLVVSLSRPSVAVFYTASMAALAGHMIHGLRTAAMDTGLTGTARRVRQVDTIAKAVGGVVALGNVSIPVAVLSKVVR